MAIYPALYSWLVGPGLPLDHLYFKRLPKDNPTGKDVVVAVILAPGSSEPEKHIGRRDLADQGDSITDDGGILWVSTGLLFQVRADKGFEVMADHVINRVMRRMLMIQGERVLPEATDVEPFSTWEETFGIRLERERLFYVELIDSPSDEEQDTKERIVTRLEMDVRHYAVPLPLQAVGTLTGGLAAVLDGRASHGRWRSDRSRRDAAPGRWCSRRLPHGRSRRSGLFRSPPHRRVVPGCCDLRCGTGCGRTLR